MGKHVIIMQGVPGSGKSTVASNAAADQAARAGRRPVTVVVSADHYFDEKAEKAGLEYQDVFNPAELGAAHEQCMRRFLRAVRGADAELVIVDNTNVTVDQMSPYYLTARALGATVEVVRVDCDPDVAHGRNTHGVPLSAVRRMHSRMASPPKFWKCIFRRVRTD